MGWEDNDDFTGKLKRGQNRQSDWKWTIATIISILGILLGALAVLAATDVIIINIDSNQQEQEGGEDTPSGTATAASTSQAVTPRTITTLTIPGNNQNGVDFTVPETGTYIFRYVDGSYCTYPINRAPTGVHSCLTTVVIFREGMPLWESDNYSINQWSSEAMALARNAGDGVTPGFWETMDDAENAAQTQASDVKLQVQQGETLLLLAVDGKDFYSDNPGEVIVEILFQQ